MFNKCLYLFILLLLFTTQVFAADIELKWEPASGADYYEIELTIDFGITWSTPRVANDPNNPTSFIWTGAPNSGILLFRATSVNSSGARATKFNAGAWYNGDWAIPDSPIGTGIVGDK